MPLCAALLTELHKCGVLNRLPRQCMPTDVYVIDARVINGDLTVLAGFCCDAVP